MKKAIGFNLMELMIVLVIVGILTTLTLPLYSNHLVKARRLGAETGLIQLASAMERYDLLHSTYKGATLDNLNIPETLEDKSYQLVIASVTANDFVIKAVPLHSQAEKDVACGTLLLDSTGKKDITGSARVSDCWENHG
ncbi:MAG TPA: type IV pilin protein [Gammaproteobacteria bacterium]|nr:type IV pilin protein [Gammaproteobacteria bacterium]